MPWINGRAPPRFDGDPEMRGYRTRNGFAGRVTSRGHETGRESPMARRLRHDQEGLGATPTPSSDSFEIPTRFESMKAFANAALQEAS